MNDDQLKLTKIVDYDKVNNAIQRCITFLKVADAFYKTWIGKLIGENRIMKYCERYIEKQMTNI